MGTLTELILSSDLADKCRVSAHLDRTVKQLLCFYYLIIKYKPLKPANLLSSEAVKTNMTHWSVLANENALEYSEWGAGRKMSHNEQRNKSENQSFTKAKMIRENISPPLKEEGGQTTYDPRKGEVFNATFLSVFIMKHFCKP